ncbi:MAG: hypothetical protein CMF55_00265 [Legionellales bacterium]|nr:hypothetical protein [Legionellales bacterium]|tara:strand:+ start:2138 stop:2449 length:312 start_codon:yes stop_codon:yes gene_type:complete
MSKTIFDRDQHSVTTFEESADNFTLTRFQDAEPIVNNNKKEFNSGVNNPTHSSLGRKVASIPLTVWENWMKETKGLIQKDPTLLAKYLNDPDNKYFRTHNSVV